jgi:hypothetical protein
MEINLNPEAFSVLSVGFSTRNVRGVEFQVIHSPGLDPCIEAGKLFHEVLGAGPLTEIDPQEPFNKIRIGYESRS